MNLMTIFDYTQQKTLSLAFTTIGDCEDMIFNVNYYDWNTSKSQCFEYKTLKKAKHKFEEIQKRENLK